MHNLEKKVFDAVISRPVLAKIAPIFGSLTHKIKTVSPELYLIGGIVTGVAAAVMAAKTHKENGNTITGIVDDIRDEQVEEVSADFESLKVQLYGELARTTIKVYGPSVAMGTASVFMILKSHGIIKGRNAGTVAALQLVEQGFAQYRARVTEELGADKDAHYRYGTEERTVITVTKNEDGKKKRNKSIEQAIPEVMDASIYARVFDETNPEFGPDKELNAFFLRANEKYMNDILVVRQVVLLNDVYDALRIPRSSEGAVVGWSLNNNPESFIDLRIDAVVNRRTGDNRFILDPNVDGVVFEDIGNT